MKAVKKRILTIFLTILFCIGLIVAVFAGAYYFFINRSYTLYEKNIHTIINTINVANNSTTIFIKDKTIDLELVKKELPKKIDILLSTKEKLQTINATDKYKKNQDNLYTGLNNNILIYKEIFAVLTNPQNSDTEKSIATLEEYMEGCMNNYTLATIKNESINLSDKSLAFIDTTISYIHEIDRLKKDSDLKQTQVLDFISRIDSLSSKFATIKIDFTSNLLNARNGSLSYEDLLTLIDENMQELADFKKEFSKVTAPPKTISMSTFSKSINSYDFYLQELKYTVTTEELQGTKNKQNQSIGSADTATMEIFFDSSQNYSTFMDLYINFKNALTK